MGLSESRVSLGLEGNSSWEDLLRIQNWAAGQWNGIVNPITSGIISCLPAEKRSLTACICLLSQFYLPTYPCDIASAKIHSGSTVRGHCSFLSKHYLGTAAWYFYSAFEVSKLRPTSAGSILRILRLLVQYDLIHPDLVAPYYIWDVIQMTDQMTIVVVPHCRL